jgi:hypothetical protein
MEGFKDCRKRQLRYQNILARVSFPRNKFRHRLNKFRN